MVRMKCILNRRVPKAFPASLNHDISVVKICYFFLSILDYWTLKSFVHGCCMYILFVDINNMKKGTTNFPVIYGLGRCSLTKL